MALERCNLTETFSFNTDSDIKAINRFMFSYKTFHFDHFYKLSLDNYVSRKHVIPQ